LKCVCCSSVSGVTVFPSILSESPNRPAWNASGPSLEIPPSTTRASGSAALIVSYATFRNSTNLSGVSFQRQSHSFSTCQYLTPFFRPRASLVPSPSKASTTVVRNVLNSSFSYFIP
jgi:hypothetical protein